MKYNFQFIYGSAIFLLFTLVARAEPAHFKEEKLNSYLQQVISENKTLGLSVLVFQNNKEVFYRELGVSDRETKREWSRDTLVNIYSMTKPVTGITLMTLYEEGLFKLDDPVSRYLPEFSNLRVFETLDSNDKPILRPIERPITILDLMRHTSGIGYDWEGNYPAKQMEKLAPFLPEKPLKQMSEEIASLPLHFQPGTQWLYGASVDIQARLAEVLSGIDYQTLVTQKVLSPLKMNNTGYFVPGEQKHKVSAIYIKNDDGTFIREPDELVYGLYSSPPVQINGGHGLISTIDDYMRFALMLQNKGELDGVRIVKPETLDLMTKNHLPQGLTEKSWLPSKGNVGFGLNFAVRIAPPKDSNENFGVVGEFFWDGLASTLFWVDPTNDITVVFFTQKLPFDEKLHKGIRKHVYEAFGMAY
ncbi:beta-lactamase family protein [Alteromonas sp. 5E99-2]|uniref:serine hydrolase domain-containing protein n=1 Tax=Alteromonas sp. 5E99-2 TaxID=2817683 RepID=UPI001A981093|nr:serine hydrolase domain-containing protein [Alteromonas sp. 5E99-2]MBO1256064.1 beta-lactamase family protein [Alteromonas sp. 5E99-2]